MSKTSDFEIKDGVLKRCVGAPSGSIKIPLQVKIIGANAFRGKQSLTEVILHDDIEEIGDCAFEQCSKLSTIVFPERLKRIGWGAFWGCSSLDVVKLPDVMDEIGNYAFDRTGWLDSQGGNVYAGGFLIRAENTVASAVEQGTNGIVGSAFSGCNDIKTITIPDSISYIGRGAFGNCGNLRELIISRETLQRLGEPMIERACFEIPPLRLDNEEAFRSCITLRFLLGEELGLGEAKEILYKALRKKKNRNNLIGYFIERGDIDALARMLSIQKKLPLEEVEGYYQQAESKEGVACKAVILEYRNRYYSADDVIQHHDEQIEKTLGIKELSISDWRKIYKFSVEDGKATITGYRGSETVVIIPEHIGENSVLGISEGAFSKSIIKEITIPEGVIQINKDTFSKCQFLEAVHLPSSLRIFGHSAFASCKKLRRINWPSKVKEIRPRAFFNCENLTEMMLPESLRKIGNWAFHGCKALVAIHIPAGVTNIGKDVFAQCPNLTIYAPAGSLAEQYAKENNIPFVEE